MDISNILENARLASVISGLLAYLSFNRLDPRNPIAWLILTFDLPLVGFTSLNDGKFDLSNTILLILIHNLTLILSFISYRLSPFHPLAQYPGPWQARVSQVYLIQMARRGKRHVEIQELHKQYGTHVRIGPNTLSIVDVEAIKDCLGTNGMPKAAYHRFTNILPLNILTSLSSAVPDHAQIHSSKRKIWDQAFTDTSLKEFDEFIGLRSAQLVKRLGEQQGTADLPKWISYFTFDFMGDFVFGGGFEMLRDGGDTSGFWKFVLDGVKAANILNHLEWTSQIANWLPMAEGVRKMDESAEQRVDVRAERGPTTKDLFYFIAENANAKSDKPLPSKREVIDEMLLAIIAGSDTTSSVLANTLYSLLTHPSARQKLREEIDSEFGGEDPTDASKLAGLPYLNAVINESLRLYPAVPFSISRTPEPGSGGKVVAGRFVPEGTTVYLPVWPLHRDPRYFFPSPNGFVPERWVEKKGSGTLNRDAFNPFSYGPANCVGKHLAYREMRVVIARIVQQYNMEFEKGYNPKEWPESLHDETIFFKGRLPVILSERK